MNFIIRSITFLLFLISFQANHVFAQKGMRHSKIKKAEKFQLAEHAFTEGMKNYILGNYSTAIAHFEESQKINGDNAAANYMLGKMYLQKDRPDIALQYASKALKQDDKNKYYYLLLAEIYDVKQDYQELLKVYKRLLAEVPHSEEYNYNIAELYFYLKNYDEALKTFTKIDDEFGKSLPVTERKQEIYLKTNHLDLAIKEGESLINAYPDDPEYKISQANFLFKNKMADKAIELLEQVLKDYPEESYARMLLSDIYQSQGKTEKSDKELESVFNDPETDVDAKINIIVGYLRAKDTPYNVSKAESLGAATVKTHPGESKAYMVYGESLLKANKKQDAWINFIKAKNLDASNYNLWMQVVSLDLELKKYDSMVVHTEQALETFPNQAVLWLYNGLGYSSQKNFAKAIEVLEEGKKLTQGNQKLLLEFNTHLADNYNNTKDYQKSDAIYDEILKTEPNNEHALNNYSYFLSLRKDKLEQAKTMSEKLLKRYPSEPNYMDTHAWVLYQMKDYEGAKKHLEMAVKMSNNGTIVEHYGDVLYQLGQKDQALEQWKKAKQLGEASELIDKKISDKKLYE